MQSQESNLVRKQFLISKESVKKLNQLAKLKHISASEIVRQAIDSFDPDDTQDLSISELKNLVSVRLKDAIASTKIANKKVADALTHFSDTGVK